MAFAFDYTGDFPPPNVGNTMRQIIAVLATLVAIFTSANASALVINSVNTPIAFTISGDRREYYLRQPEPLR